MATLAGQEQQEFSAPAAAVWSYRLDFTNLAAYNPAVSDVELLDPPDTDTSPLETVRHRTAVAGQGARYRFMLDTPVGAHRVTLTVTEVTQDRLVATSMQSAMTASETFTVDPLPGGRSLATLSLWLDLPGGLDRAHVDQLVESGRAQIRAELDAMALVLNRS